MQMMVFQSSTMSYKVNLFKKRNVVNKAGQKWLNGSATFKEFTFNLLLQGNQWKTFSAPHMPEETV